MGMQAKVRNVGGGSAKPTADAFNSFLLNQLESGNLSNIFNQTLSGGNNPASGFNPLTYQVPNFDTNVGMDNPIFAARQATLDRQTQMGLADMRTRFGAMGRGSNAAMAEAAFLSQANPANMLAMNDLANSMRTQNRMDLGMQSQDTLARMGMNLQNQQFGAGQRMQGLGMLMGGLQQSNALGTPQAQTIMQPSGFGQALGAVATLAPFAMAPFTGGASLGMPGTMPNLNFFRGMGGLMTGQGFGGFMNPTMPPGRALGMPPASTPFVPTDLTPGWKFDGGRR